MKYVLKDPEEKFYNYEAKNQDDVKSKEHLEDTIDWLDPKRLMFNNLDNDSDT